MCYGHVYTWFLCFARFLEQGLHPDLVAGATHTKDFARRFPRSNLAQVQEEALVDEEDPLKESRAEVQRAYAVAFTHMKMRYSYYKMR